MDCAVSSHLPSSRPGQARIPCVLMRGGTSRGPFFLESDLPQDPAARNRILLAVLGSPHALQLDGIGGGHPLTSKVAIIGPPSHPDAHVDYLFAQVAVDRPHVDLAPNCGNMLSAVGPFAIEAGLVSVAGGETTVKIFNRNTSVLVEAVVQTPAGLVRYDGETAIDGVAGTAAPIKLTFLNAAGSKTGALLPTGLVGEQIDGVPVTLIDYSVPMMLVRAVDLGLEGDESPEVLDTNHGLLDRLEALRLEAGRRMGLGDVRGRVVPKIALLSPSRHGGTVTSRYFVPDRCHRSHAVTGALCVAVACRLPGTVAYDQADAAFKPLVTVEHPSGRLQVQLDFGADDRVANASLVRTARRIFEGSVVLPVEVGSEALDTQRAP